MKLLYGVVGEGMGHAMRSSVVLDHLHAAGHEVRILVSGRAAQYLEKRHPGQVIPITGLTMSYEDNVVKKRRTLLENLKSAVDVPENVRAYLSLGDFQPDAVISDFESVAYIFARGEKIPVISLDNMQIIARCHHDAAVLDDMASFLLAKGIVKLKLPRANAYLITTFFYPPIKKERTSLHPPLLRKVILDAKPNTARGEHVLVYQSGSSHDSLIDVLRAVDAPFYVYGLRRDVEAPLEDGNLTHFPFSETRFIEHLATARAVIAGGGFTLMGEAIFFQKPMLSVPLVGQFEQTLNAAYLERLGYGARADHIDVAGVRRFLERTDEYGDALASFAHDHNAGLLAALDAALIAGVEEGPRF